MTDGIAELGDLIGAGEVVALSGAGLSTDSGIPDYRGPSGALRRHTPMTYQTFVSGLPAQRRYWARSHLGWRHVARATPNDGHRGVAKLQEYGALAGLITQNVDGLQQAAGARDVIELHGSLDRVLCLSCGARTPRESLDRRLRRVNPAFEGRVTAINPDGDANLGDEDLDGFQVVHCLACGGVLKPDVVFFGESVPRERVQRCFELVERARLLLVLGSSLTVMSGYRFVLHAGKHGVPVAIVNQGPTRGDARAALKLDAPLGEVLPRLAAVMAGGNEVVTAD
ncbi:MAG: NAD-dependent protein deacetylase [Actinomycetota bacterium]|nr:NAD-dependent protein deacetylase [Actinomycetota bacterium]